MSLTSVSSRPMPFMPQNERGLLLLFHRWLWQALQEISTYSPRRCDVGSYPVPVPAQAPQQQEYVLNHLLKIYQISEPD